jgi:uncharacterized protein involved in tolerance to divalent cations
MLHAAAAAAAAACCLQGKVEKDAEVLLIIKTQAHLLDSLTAKVGANTYCYGITACAVH